MAQLPGLHAPEPQFRLEKVLLQFSNTFSIKQMHVNNNIMCIVTLGCIYRINLSNPSKVLRFSLTNGSSIAETWADETGTYLIARSTSDQYFHLHKSYEKFKILPKLNGFKIRTLKLLKIESHNALFIAVTDSDTIHLGSLSCHEPLENKRDDKKLRQVFESDFRIRDICIIDSGIVAFGSEIMLEWSCQGSDYAAIESTMRKAPQRIHIDIGKYELVIVISALTYLIFGTESRHVLTNDPEISLLPPDRLQLLPNFNVETDSIIAMPHHLLHIETALGSIHVYDKIRLEEVKEINVRKAGPLVGRLICATQDIKKHTYWIYTEEEIFEIIALNESSAVWQSYLKLGLFDKAIELLNKSEAGVVNYHARNLIAIEHGYALLKKGRLDSFTSYSDLDEEEYSSLLESMKKLAQLSKAIAEVAALCSLRKHDFSESAIFAKELFITYLKEVLKTPASKELSPLQKSIIAAWIVQIHLEIIITWTKWIKEYQFLSGSTNSRLESARLHMDRTNLSLRQFIASNVHILDSLTVYQLLRKLDTSGIIIEFANLAQDFHFIVQRHLDSESWDDALDTIAKFHSIDAESSLEVLYRASSILLTKTPRKTLETFLKFEDIDYQKILPSILSLRIIDQSNTSTLSQILEFLRVLIFEKKIRNYDIFTTFLSSAVHIFHTKKRQQDRALLMNSLARLRGSEWRNGVPDGTLIYDAAIILRLSLRFEIFEAAIYILLHDFRKYESAMRLALKEELFEMAENIISEYEKQRSGSSITSNQSDDFLTSVSLQPQSSPLTSRDSDSLGKRLIVIFARDLIRKFCSGVRFIAPENGIGILQALSGERREFMNDLDDESQEELVKLIQYIRIKEMKLKGRRALTIQEILSWLPQGLKMKHLKATTVSSLNAYEKRVKHLNLEQQILASVIKNLQQQFRESELNSSRGKIGTVLLPGENCDVCGNLLYRNSFVVFPNCHHAIHGDCIVRNLQSKKSNYRLQKILRVFQKSPSLSDKREIELLLRRSCVLCDDIDCLEVDNFIYSDSHDDFSPPTRTN